MTFASVFKSLKEVFPQVDHRMLKAVAIEHTDDIDAAVEFILTDVLPSICSSQEAPHDLIDNKDDKHLSMSSPEVTNTFTDCQDAGHSPSGQFQMEEQWQLWEHQEAINEANAGPSELRFIASKHGGNSHHSNESAYGSSSILRSQDENYSNQLNVNTENEELRSSEEHEDNLVSVSHHGSPAVSSYMTSDDLIFFGSKNIAPASDLVEPEAYDTNLIVSSSSVLVANPVEMENIEVLIDSSYVPKESQELEQDASENEITSKIDSRNPEEAGSLETVSGQMDPVTKLASLEDESFSTTVFCQSNQNCRIDVLEDSIREAKNNKKTLFQSMESVILMMREVENLEKAAERAQEEAVMGGLDILVNVEDIRKMLLHAREANDMRSGEVYGEKAILATEARELQSRLLNLSYERDKSLAILNEMRQALEARMLAAEEVRKTAEQDKFNKEVSAREALLEQELIMEKVVQESKRLQSEAEENSKLQEFLMDRGRVLDILQGEIAVVCKDVKSLKENFDDRAPLSKSLSSSQTSCILASSGSSGKSVAYNLIPEQLESSESPKMTNTTHVDDSSEKSTREGTEGVHKMLMDDDWDLFEDEADLYNSNH